MQELYVVTKSWTQLKQFRIYAYTVQKNSIKCETKIQVNGREKVVSWVHVSHYLRFLHEHFRHHDW